jgi:DMSO/TMAO reductase YedYZ molybdopterin-dependent catalytic subunit
LKDLIRKNRWAFSGLVLGLMLVLAGAGYYIWDSVAVEEPIDWQLTLKGSKGQEKILEFDEILEMPSEEARGGFFSTVGVIYGPYEVKGVAIEDLCNFVGGISENDLVSISATDGYAMVFDYEQIYTGNIQTYDPVDLHEVPHEKQMILLTYEWDNEMIPYNEGKPLRLAVVGSEALLTEGHNWVKWVNLIEVIQLD